MMRWLSLLLLAASCRAHAAGDWLEAAHARLASRRPLSITAVALDPPRVPRYARLELAFQVGGSYDNPFDPREIDVAAEFTSPSGATLNIPAFFFQGFARGEDGAAEATGQPCWKVRFAPVETGRHTCRIRARDHTGARESAERSFECVPSDREGFVRIHPRNPRYLALDSGKVYLPMGINLFHFTRLGEGIPRGRLDTCLAQLAHLANHGGNFARLRADSWWLALEMRPDEACGYLGLGTIQQQTAWEIDRILDFAAARRIRLMFCIGNANANVNAPAQPWRKAYNQYAQDNGGPCKSPRAFWTHPEARRLVRQKIRYVVARWAYSPHVMAWEFWNEVSLQPCPAQQVAAWHREMARHWRALDPYNRPITTSLMGSPGGQAAAVWKLPELDIVQEHLYNRPDIAAAHSAAAREAARLYRKPFFIGEYGGSSRSALLAADPTGVQLHNGLWAPAFSGSCGTAAFWFIANYVEPQDLYFHYRAFADFARDIAWERRATTFRIAEPHPTAAPPAEQRKPIDLPLPRSSRWTFEKPPVTEFLIGPDGSTPNAEMIRPYLHCQSARKAPPTFVVNLVKPARFEIHVTRSVGNESQKLLVHLDGRKVHETPFPAGKGKGLRRGYVQQYDNWRCDYDQRIIIHVPAGQHRIRPEAVGKDRLEVSYTVRGFLATEPRRTLRVWSFDDARCLYFWVQSKVSTVGSLERRIAPSPVAGMATTIEGLPDGRYIAQWWDTWHGKWHSEAAVDSRGGTLELAIPELVHDLACRIRRQDATPLRR